MSEEIKVNLISDATPFHEALDLFKSLIQDVEVSREVSGALIDNIKNIELCNIDSKATVRAENLVCFVKPGKGLLDLIAALGTCEGKLELSDIEKIIHND